MLNTGLLLYVQKGVVKMIKKKNIKVIFEDSKIQTRSTNRESVWPRERLGTCHAIFSFGVPDGAAQLTTRSAGWNIAFVQPPPPLRKTRAFRGNKGNRRRLYAR